MLKKDIGDAKGVIEHIQEKIRRSDKDELLRHVKEQGVGTYGHFLMDALRWFDFYDKWRSKDSNEDENPEDKADAITNKSVSKDSNEVENESNDSEYLNI